MLIPQDGFDLFNICGVVQLPEAPTTGFDLHTLDGNAAFHEAQLLQALPDLERTRRHLRILPQRMRRVAIDPDMVKDRDRFVIAENRPV